jgi:hypothetical protein
MPVPVRRLLVAIATCFCLVAVGARADPPGPGNARAARTARASLLVAQARHDLRQLVAQLGNRALRRATVDAIENPATCIRHRAGLDDAGAAAIVAQLIAAHLLGDPAQATDAPTRARLIGAVFPPVLDAGGACPHLPQPFYAAPGGDADGHHNWPGGLVVHTAFNTRLAQALARAYDHQTRLISDHDAVIAAALWHDWAKTLVFQWQADGREFAEVPLGGQGVADNAGLPGDSRTGAHHILGLAEAMARGLPPGQVLVQACAHASPTNNQAWKLVNWLRAAALIARIDPVRQGYLRTDTSGRPALPTPPGGSWLAECLIHFQSDQNWVMAEPAARQADAVLAQLAGQFGYDPADTGRYRTAYRNVVLSQLGADHIQLRNQRGGLAAVAADLRRLRQRGII